MLKNIILILLFATTTEIYSQPSTALNFIKQKFDVIDYELKLDLSAYPLTECNGINKISISKSEPTDFYFHLQDLTIDSIIYNDEKINFEFVDDVEAYYKVLLTSNNEIDHLEIYYHGNMTHEDNDSKWGGVSRSSSHIFSMGVGFQANYVSCARHFMPCYDHPSDPATFSLELTVPNDIVAASNGLLQEFIDNEDNDVYRWKQSVEAPTYTLSFAIGNFEVHEFGSDIPVIVYGSRFLDDAMEYVFPSVENMINAYEDQFYDYPYEKAGYVLTAKGSMEHSSCIHIASSVVSRYYSNQDKDFYTVAHELAHQWFGNDIHIEDFREAWLSEGFAVFCEALWKRSYDGNEGFIKKLEEDAVFYLNTSTQIEGVLSLYDYDREPPSSNYPSTIYYKGSVVLYMLMQKVGEENFFKGFDEYFKNTIDRGATSQLFKESIEAASGIDLTGFFDQWVYGKGFPIIDITLEECTEHIGAGMCINKVVIEQIQDNSELFYDEVPIDIEFINTDGTTEYRTFVFSGERTEIDIQDDLIINGVASFNSGEQFKSLIQVNDIILPVNSVAERFNLSTTISPNPANAIINIQSDEFLIDNYQIFSTLGKKEFSGDLKMVSEFNIDIKSLATGSYILKLKSGNNTVFKKIIKE